MAVGDMVNFLLGGIPGEIHDAFIKDVEPDDLIRAAWAMTDMSTGACNLQKKLQTTVSDLQANWSGPGVDAFTSDLWLPLNDGLIALSHQCAHAAGQFADLSFKAAAGYAEKVDLISQEVQGEAMLMAGTTMLASPEVGGAISEAIGRLATRLAGELVGSIVQGLLDAILGLIRAVSNAFGRLFGALTSTFVAQKAELVLARVLPRQVPVLPSPAELAAIAGQNRAAGSTEMINEMVQGGTGQIDLIEQEGLGPSRDGGHTLRQGHVGRTDPELLTWPKKEASTFTDLRTTNACVTAAIKQNRQAIQDWMSMRPTGKPKEFLWRAPAAVGRIRLSNDGVVSTDQVRVVLQLDERGNLIVLTAYPLAPSTI